MQTDSGNGTDRGATGARHRRVLLVEDETVTRMAAATLLRRAGHEVVAVESGPSAVAAVVDAAAGANPFDLVLMDLGLPGFDGDEAARRIRANPATGPGRTLILMLSATATPAGLERCRSCGADGLLAKPLTLDALAAALRGDAAPMPSANLEVDPAILTQMTDMLPPGVAAGLIAKTAATLRQYHETLTAARIADDREAIGAMAHKVAGVAGQYGCVALRCAAKAVEAAAAFPPQNEDTAVAFAALDSAYGPALRHLDGFAVPGGSLP